MGEGRQRREHSTSQIIQTPITPETKHKGQKPRVKMPRKEGQRQEPKNKKAKKNNQGHNMTIA